MPKLLFTYLFFLTTLFSYGQGNNSKSGKITGKILDRKTNYPIEYANIVLYNQKDSVLVTGTITDSKGKFILEQIAFGEYFLKCNFLGYKQTTIDNIYINANMLKKNLKTIILKPSVENLNEVLVGAEKPRIEYKIDKQIINVSKDIISSGGSAVDVLENVPSIKTDLQGNVYLRGGGFMLLAIDVGNKCGTSIYAAASGKIVREKWGVRAGRYIIIEHANKTKTLYAHLSKFLIHLGAYVKQGQRIGLMGTSGRSTGCHLHFDVYGARNPLARYRVGDRVK